MNDVLEKYIELWGMEDDYCLFKDGSIGFGLKISSFDISSYSDESINNLSTRLKNFLNSIPENIDLQFVQDINADNFSVLDRYEDLDTVSKNSLSKELLKERVERFYELNAYGLLPNHSFYLFVRKPFSKKLTSDSWFKSKAQIKKVSENKLKAEIKEMSLIKTNLMDSLKKLEIESKTLISEELLSTVFKQWNPNLEFSSSALDLEDVGKHLTLTDIEVNKKGFEISDYKFRIISLKNLPEQTFSSMAKYLQSLPFNSKLFLSIHSPVQEKELDQLKNQHRVAFSMSSDQGRATDIDSRSKHNDLENTLEEVISQGEKIFHVSLNILLKSQDTTELEDQVSQTLSLIREMNGSEAMAETIAGFDIFKELSIPNARAKERSLRLKTSNLADFIPLYSSWKGHDRPSLILRSLEGSIMSFDPFDSSYSNANQLISAGSGAGKSVFTNLSILQMLKENPRVFFVDIGGSYKKLCENLDGQYISLGLSENVSINPFSLPEGETEPSHDKIKFLVGLVELITKEADEKALPKLTKSLLEESILRLYKINSEPRLNDLRKLLLESDVESLNQLGKILKSWCGNSAYGHFIDRPTSVSLEKDLVAFDLKDLEKFPELQSVCLYLITDFIWSNIQKERYRMKFVIFDECWKLLKDKAGQSFIESIFRTCRKYYTSCIAISQAIQDFTESDIASAIIPNCSIKWLLKQGQVDSKALKNTLRFNENQISIISNLRQEKGEYSQAYLISENDQCAALMIEPTPLELWISTTNPKDLKIIEEEKAKFPEKSNLEILKKLSIEKPYGST